LDVFVIPDNAVKVGDSWTYEIKEDKKTGAAAAKASYSLVGEDKVGAIDSFKIKFSVKESGADAASSEGTMWLSKADSMLVKFSTKWVNAPVPGAPVPISGEMTVALIQ